METEYWRAPSAGKVPSPNLGMTTNAWHQLSAAWEWRCTCKGAGFAPLLCFSKKLGFFLLAKGKPKVCFCLSAPAPGPGRRRAARRRTSRTAATGRCSPPPTLRRRRSPRARAVRWPMAPAPAARTQRLGLLTSSRKIEKLVFEPRFWTLEFVKPVSGSMVSDSAVERSRLPAH